LKAQIRSGCIALPSFIPGVRYVWVVYVTTLPLYLQGKRLGTYFEVAGWNPAPFWAGMENLALSGFEPRTVQPVPTKLSPLLGRMNTIWNELLGTYIR